MIRLDRKNLGVTPYRPPIPVQPHYEDIDTSTMPVNEQITKMLWIPATLVCRFLFQYPDLRSEADELFSVGVLKLTEIVNGGVAAGKEIGAVCNISCCRAMEDYGNSLGSVVKVCTTTRYQHLNQGVDTPQSHPLPYGAYNLDDMSMLLLRDAAEALDVDLSKMTEADKYRLARLLTT